MRVRPGHARSSTTDEEKNAERNNYLAKNEMNAHKSHTCKPEYKSRKNKLRTQLYYYILCSSVVLLSNGNRNRWCEHHAVQSVWPNMNWIQHTARPFNNRLQIVIWAATKRIYADRLFHFIQEILFELNVRMGLDIIGTIASMRHARDMARLENKIQLVQLSHGIAAVAYCSSDRMNKFRWLQLCF